MKSLKSLSLILSILFSTSAQCQGLINPYQWYGGTSSTGIQYINYIGTTYNTNETNLLGLGYTGEYQIFLDLFPWGGGNNRLVPGIDAIIGNFALSYTIEAVSFPFNAECVFYPNGDCSVSNTRDMGMPSIQATYSYNNATGEKKWAYPIFHIDQAYHLHTKSTTLEMFRGLNSAHSEPSDIVSIGFKENAGIRGDQEVFPHTILKHTINIHCGIDIQNSDVLSSFSFLVDLTRGKMREYPFFATNGTNSSVKQYYDLSIRPIIWGLGPNDYDLSGTCLDYNIYDANYICENDPVKGGLNYTPFDPDDDNGCAANFAIYDQFEVGFLNDGYMPSSNGTAHKIPLPSYTVIANTFVRDYTGQNLAGYDASSGFLVELVPTASAIVHNYKIDRAINIGDINSSEKIIYNPSEVFITSPASEDLRFPGGYTFKTIHGAYPFEPDVVNANIPENGGPYSDLRKVPVVTDLDVDYHITGYLTGNPKYSSIYHLESGSKLTIEPCVKLFDCTFEINPGSEMVFENTPTNINKQRYQLLYNGGTVTERDEQWLFQNKTETRSILNYDAADFILAGRNVDSNQPQGDYIVNAGADVTFAASNQVVLKDGFRANSGSKFHAYISPTTVPGCPQRMARPDHNSSQTENVTGKNNNQFFLAPSLTTSRSFLNFKIQREGYYSIEVLNALGETQKKFYDNRFFRANTYKLDEDFTDLAPGVYICKLSGGDEQYTTKFIKSN